MLTPTDVATPLTDQAQTGLVGYVHSTLTGGAVDGPGLRFVLFTSGCQMRCLYCHNPDTWERMGGTKRTVDDVMEEIRKYAGFIRKAGGITITGGEPLMQAEFVHEVLRRCKDIALHTALDTNGLLAHRLPDEWFDVVDLVLLDIKHIDPGKHARLTGAPNRPVLEFAQRLARMGKPVWVRYVLVPGYTDDVNDVEKLAEFVGSLKNVARVEVLPFHQMGAYKWKQLGLRYELADKLPPTEGLVERVKKQFEAKGLNVV